MQWLKCSAYRQVCPSFLFLFCSRQFQTEFLTLLTHGWYIGFSLFLSLLLDPLQKPPYYLHTPSSFHCIHERFSWIVLNSLNVIINFAFSNTEGKM
jgi:hypothetical protein